VNNSSASRAKALAISTLLLLVFAVAHHIWANWGLVTVHARQQPLARVISSIQRQGRATIQTDLPGDTLVSMDCVKVPVADALETLAANTQSRWRLVYIAAGTRTALKSFAWAGSQVPDGWKMLSIPFGNIAAFAGDDAPAQDPRQDPWTLKTAAPAPIQSFFLEAAQATNASFAFPADWNPNVKSAPASGIVDKLIPKLVSAANGYHTEVFLLTRGGQRGPRNNDAAAADPQALQIDPDLLAQRAQNQINRLPDAERIEAQVAFDSEMAFRKSIAAITDPDARRAAMQQHMQDPAVQQMMANRMDGADGRLSHDQRVQHNQNYVNRKLAAMGKS
jgi:hypothetical protein